MDEGFESMGAAGPGKIRPLQCLGMDFGVQLQAHGFWSCWPLWPAVLWGRPSAALNCGSPTQISAFSRSATVQPVRGSSLLFGGRKCHSLLCPASMQCLSCCVPLPALGKHGWLVAFSLYCSRLKNEDLGYVLGSCLGWFPTLIHFSPPCFTCRALTPNRPWTCPCKCVLSQLYVLLEDTDFLAVF